MEQPAQFAKSAAATGVVRSGAWISEAWQVVQADLLMYVVATLIYMAGSSIPYVGTAVLCGIYTMTIQRLQGADRVELDGIARGFRTDIGIPALLAVLVQGGIISVLMVPLLVWALFAMGATATVGGEPLAAMATFFLVYGVGLLGACFLQLMWLLSLPIIADRRCGFWEGMERSRKIVFANFWGFLGFALCTAALQIAGLLVCGVGLLVTMPIICVAMVIAVRDMLGLQTPLEQASYGPQWPPPPGQ